MAQYTQPTPRLTVIQSFQYRAKAEEFSNTYSFKGPAPGNPASWQALADSVINALKPCYSSIVTFVRVYGYLPDTVGADFVHDYTVPGPPSQGSGSFPTATKMPGDAAITGRMTSDKRDKRGKIVYSHHYWHDAHAISAGNPDQVDSGQQGAFTTFLTAWAQATIASVFDSCLPDGTDTHSPHVDQWITTRTLHKRGKRKINQPGNP